MTKPTLTVMGTDYLAKDVANTNSTAIEDEFDKVIYRDGSAPATGALPMGSNKITGLADGTAATDAAAFGQLNELAISGITASADEVNILDGATLTTVELNYVDGVTSAIQTQLDAKSGTSHTHDGSTIDDNSISADELFVTGDGTAGYALVSDGDGSFSWAVLAGGGDMTAAVYDAAAIAEQVVGLTTGQTLTNKTLTTPTLTLAQSASPTPTAEGDIQWDTDDNTIVIGDGASQKTFSDDSKVLLTADAGALATLDEVDAGTIVDNSVGADELNVSGDGAAGEYLTSDGDGSMSWLTPSSDYIKISDHKASGTDGGTATAGSFAIRTLNTIDDDTGSIASLSTNRVSLPAGTYIYRGRCPGYAVNAHMAQLYNYTDSSVVSTGISSFSISAACTYTSVEGSFVIAGTKEFELRHRCATATATNGWGVKTTFGVDEVYSVLELWRIG